MATPKDLNRKHTSGISYARAAKKYGVDISEAKAYAQMAKAYNKQAREWARDYGYKGDLWKAPSLGDIARESGAARRFGGVQNLFGYMQEEIAARLADKPKLVLKEKAKQYAANLLQALRNNPESAFPESDVSKAIKKLEKRSARWIMRKSGGEVLDVYYSGEIGARGTVIQKILEW